MPGIGYIAWKELRGYFSSWMAYVLLFGWLAMGGFIFFLLMQRATEFELAPLFQILITVLLFMAPLITMRLIAEERNTGTIEMLFTSPLTEWQVTLGKFLGSWAFVGVMILLTLHFPFFSTRFGSIDTGPVWGSYIALVCAGAAFVAFGLFCSSLTDSQVVAGFLTFGGLLMSWMLSWPAQSMAASDLAAFVGHFSVFTHFTQMLQGAVDTKDVIFFISITLLFLYATVRILESRKWR